MMAVSFFVGGSNPQEDTWCDDAGNYYLFFLSLSFIVYFIYLLIGIVIVV